MLESFVIDEKTNLPKLPDGYYWYLSPSSYYGSYSLSMQLHQWLEPTKWQKFKMRHPKWGWLFDVEPPYRRLEQAGFSLHAIPDEEAVRDRIKAEAAAMYDKWIEKMRAAELYRYVKSLRGEYPPKKLEN
jgi:hypothetical protein